MWDWQKGTVLHQANGGPDKILDCAWSTTDEVACTVGIKHIFFWNVSANF
jgi:hypothetical protein